MNRTWKYLTASAAAVLLTATFSATAATQGQINSARAQCHVEKEQVKAKGAFARDDQKQNWEKACGRANTLMDQSAGAEFAAFETTTAAPAASAAEPASAPAATPAPAPTAEPAAPAAAAPAVEPGQAK